MVDLHFLVALLLIVIAVMLVLWKPWQDNIKATDRTITVTGDASLKATPDEYVFYPSYDFTNTDRTAALNELKQKNDEIVGKLKSLGVEDSKIKTNANDYQKSLILPNTNDTTYTLTLTITIGSKDLAQKVQDYLVSTSPSGAITPQADFSAAKRKALEAQARDQATQAARSKAEQTAKNLGFKIIKIKAVDDGTGFGGPEPLQTSTDAANAPVSSTDTKLTIQPGENQLNYSVKVIYYIR